MVGGTVRFVYLFWRNRFEYMIFTKRFSPFPDINFTLKLNAIY